MKCSGAPLLKCRARHVTCGGVCPAGEKTLRGDHRLWLFSLILGFLEPKQVQIGT